MDRTLIGADACPLGDGADTNAHRDDLETDPLQMPT